MLVHPFAPFGIVDGEHSFIALLFGESGDEGLRSFAYGRGGNAGGTDGKQARLDGSVGGDPLEWLG